MSRSIIGWEKIIDGEKGEMPKKEKDDLIAAYNDRSKGNLVKFFREGHVADGTVTYVLAIELGDRADKKWEIIMLKCVGSDIEEITIKQRDFVAIKDAFNVFYGKLVVDKI